MTFIDRPGPTPQRLEKAENHYAIGDDKQGGKLYQFHDSTMDRVYSRLTRELKARADEEALRLEYFGLQRYKHHWYHGGLQASLGSVDLNRIFASDPGSMSGMAKSERQFHHRHQYRAARAHLGVNQALVADCVVCEEKSLEQAGYAIGYNSPYRARQASLKVLRDAGQRLARFWGVG